MIQRLAALLRPVILPSLPGDDDEQKAQVYDSIVLALGDQAEQREPVVVTTVRAIDVTAVQPAESHRFILGRPFPNATLVGTSQFLGPRGHLFVRATWLVPETVVYEQVAAEAAAKGTSVYETLDTTGDLRIDPIRS